MKAIPLGGMGEFGMNMMVYEYDGDMIVVDCGIMFPDAELLGVDIVCRILLMFGRTGNACAP